jgi:hypothetical protein
MLQPKRDGTISLAQSALSTKRTKVYKIAQTASNIHGKINQPAKKSIGISIAYII